MTTYNGQFAVRDHQCALLYGWNAGLASNCLCVSVARAHGTSRMNAWSSDAIEGAAIAAADDEWEG